MIGTRRENCTRLTFLFQTNSFSILSKLDLTLKTLKVCHQTKKGKRRKLFHSQTKSKEDGEAGRLQMEEYLKQFTEVPSSTYALLFGHLTNLANSKSQYLSFLEVEFR
jgi:hypothetical protein